MPSLMELNYDLPILYFYSVCTIIRQVSILRINFNIENSILKVNPKCYYTWNMNFYVKEMWVCTYVYMSVHNY